MRIAELRAEAANHKKTCRTRDKSKCVVCLAYKSALTVPKIQRAVLADKITIAGSKEGIEDESD